MSVPARVVLDSQFVQNGPVRVGRDDLDVISRPVITARMVGSTNSRFRIRRDARSKFRSKSCFCVPLFPGRLQQGPERQAVSLADQLRDAEIESRNGIGILGDPQHLPAVIEPRVGFVRIPKKESVLPPPSARPACRRGTPCSAAG